VGERYAVAAEVREPYPSTLPGASESVPELIASVERSPNFGHGAPVASPYPAARSFCWELIPAPSGFFWVSARGREVYA
jgi:hypothetical protein